jgi:predicted transposase/invertase (TIGR01784 family)
MKTNNMYKNNVFTMLFSEPALLRELYCALDGVSLPPDVPVTINTLENVLFMGQYNDISFEIGGKLVVLIEHQSTINPNMALRLLMYIGRVYEKIIDGDKLYSKNPVLIPQPEFFVLYNGTDPFPDQEIYRLSGSFEKLKDLDIAENDTPALELLVKVININEGRNKAIVDRCKELAEYSTLVAKIRYYLKKYNNLEEAIKKAVIYCKKHGILVELLKLHAAEVLSMLMTEWNQEDALAVRYKEGHEEGEVKGREEGRFNEKLEIARNLLTKGSSLEFVHEITGLDIDTLKGLKR